MPNRPDDIPPRETKMIFTVLMGPIVSFIVPVGLEFYIPFGTCLVAPPQFCSLAVS